MTVPGTSQQYDNAVKIHTKFGEQSFTAEQLRREGIPIHGSTLNGMVMNGLLKRERIHKAARNRYTLRMDNFTKIGRKWG